MAKGKRKNSKPFKLTKKTEQLVTILGLVGVALLLAGVYVGYMSARIPGAPDEQRVHDSRSERILQEYGR